MYKPLWFCLVEGLTRSYLQSCSFWLLIAYRPRHLGVEKLRYPSLQSWRRVPFCASCYALFVIDGCDLHTRDGFPDTFSGIGLKDTADAIASGFPAFLPVCWTLRVLLLFPSAHRRLWAFSPRTTLLLVFKTGITWYDTTTVLTAKRSGHGDELYSP